MIENIETSGRAITQSALIGDTVHVYDNGDIKIGLEVACDDWKDCHEDENGNVICEYWGVDGDGDGWDVWVHVKIGETSLTKKN